MQSAPVSGHASDHVDDVLVVGGGIVGLATAYQLLRLRPGLRLRLLEKEPQLATHQTGHNSGVIHSGLYYKPGSQKANLCLAGYQELLSFCREHFIDHDICGKVVVATTPEEVDRLESLRQRGQANGLQGLRMLCPEELLEREPYCAGLRALLVPQTGIVDYRQVAEKLADLIRASGAEIHLGERAIDLLPGQSRSDDPVRVETTSATRWARCVVACAGIQSDRLAMKLDPALSVRILPFRGEYYQLRSNAQYLINHLIYPVPDPAFPFLGVHFTRMVSGGVECGPNAVLALAREGYGRAAFHLPDLAETLLWPGFRHLAGRYWRQGLAEVWRSWSKPAFVRALQRLVPEVKTGDLLPGGVGIRAQACDLQGSLVDDFLIKEQGRVLHVCNAPSPAATASLAIGSRLAGLILQRLGG
jgi:L-2-hydroxyglutarate oxidase